MKRQHSTQHSLRRTAFSIAALAAFALPPALAAPLAGAPATGEIQVNSYTSHDQVSAGVAMSAAGDFVVTWRSPFQDGSGRGVYARRYSAAGSPAGGEIPVNVRTTGNQVPAGVAMSATGDFVVTWSSNGQDGSDYGVYARRFRANGSPASGDIAINSYTTGRQFAAGVAMSATGDFVVTWSSTGQDGSANGVYARRYNADGSPAGGEIRVNSYTTGGQFPAGVGMDADGDFVVTWSSVGQDGSAGGVYARRYNADGSPASGEIRVNSYTTQDQTSAGVAMAADGDFVVTWRSDLQDGSRGGVYARRYNADGSPASGEIAVNTTTVHEQRPVGVAMSATGDFVVTWDSDYQDRSGHGVYARLYNADGIPASGEIPVNSTTASNQLPAGVAMDADGDFVVTWTSYRQDGNRYGVYARKFSGPEDVDLSLVLTDDPDPIPPGGDYSLNLAIQNQHPAATATGIPAIDTAIGRANGLSVSVTLPVEARYRGFLRNGWACTHDSSVVECRFAGVLAPGGHTAVGLDVAGPETAGPYTTTALVRGQQFDSDEADPAISDSRDSADTSITCTPVPGASVVSLDIAQATLDEGAGRTLAVSRSNGNCGAVSVDFATASGTALAGTDFTASSGRLSWAAGDARPRRLSLLTLEDNLDEVGAAETFTLSLSNPQGGAVLGSIASSTLRILDDDPAPTIRFSLSAQNVAEGGARAVDLLLSRPSSRDVVVTLSTGGSATAGSDYQAIPTRAVIRAGTTSRALRVLTIQDTATEPAETVSLTITGATNATLGSPQTYTATIPASD